MIKNKIAILIFSVIAIIGIYSCSQGDCISNQRSSIIVRFLKKVDPTTDSLIALKQISALGTDSVFYVSDTTSQLILPVNTDSTATVYFIEFDNEESEKDTLILSYVRHQRLISPDCGIEQVYTDLKVEEKGLNPLDSLVILESNLIETDESHIVIYK